MSDEEASFLPEIQYLVFRECTSTWRLKPHTSSCYDMTYLIDGAARYTIDGIAHEVKAGDLVCVREGMQKEARTYPGRLMRCFSVNFVARDRNGESVYPPFPAISHINVKDDIVKLFEELVYTWFEQQAGYIMKSQGLLLLILHRFFELTVYKMESAVCDCRIKAAIRYITQHFTERLSVEMLAKLVNLNAAYFGALFKRETGISMSRYVAKTRIRNAENMLRSGAYRVAEVADYCGYSDMFHFSKQFKAIIGISPSRCIPISHHVGIDTRKVPVLHSNMTIREQLNEFASRRLLILDGAMGSLLQRHAFTEAAFRGERFAAHSGKLLGCNDVLCLTNPALVSAIHESYLKAGADIIETCSFNATAVSLAGFGIADCAYEISFAAATLARKAADAWSTPEMPRFVAGSMGPTAKCAGIPSDFANPAQRAVSWDELAAAYYDNARGLLDGGADLLLVETVIDSVNAKAALYAIGRLRDERGLADIPVMVSASVGQGGRILSGQSLMAFYVAMSHVDPIAIGLNCSSGATAMLPYLRQLAAVPCMVIAYPNAGMPDQAGAYGETPARMAEAVAGFMGEGLVNIVGGCCGSTPEHIAAIAEKAGRYRPRALPKPSPVLPPLSGLEPGFLPEQVAYNDGVEALLAAGDYDEAVELLRSAVEAGASYIALRLDKEVPDAPLAMRTLVSLALSYPDIARLPFVIGGSRWPVVEAALKCLPGRGLVDASRLAGVDEALIQRYGDAYLKNL